MSDFNFDILSNDSMLPGIPTVDSIESVIGSKVEEEGTTTKTDNKNVTDNENSKNETSAETTEKTSKKDEKSKEATGVTGKTTKVDISEDNEINTNSTEDESKSEVIESPLKEFAKMLGEKGIIDFTDEDFEDNDDYIIKKTNDRISAGIEEYKASIPDEIKYLIENYEEGVPVGKLIANLVKDSNYSDITVDKLEENEGMQKKILTELLEYNGDSNEEITEKLDDYESSGILFKESKRALNKLNTIREATKAREIEDAKQEKKQREDNYKAWLNNLNTTISKKTEILPGLTLSDNDKKKIFDSITKPIGKDANGNFINAVQKARMDDPDFDLKVAYFATIKNWDISSIKVVGKKEAVSSLKKAIETQGKSGSLSTVRSDKSQIENILKSYVSR